MVTRFFQFRRISHLFSPKSSHSNPNPNPNPNPNLQPTPFTKPLSATINKLFKERDLPKLISSFKLASESYRFRCRHNIYSFTIRRLAAAGHLAGVQSILEHQKRFTADLAHEGFGARLITLYGKAGMPSHAAATFDQLPSLGSPRSALSFNALLSAFAASKDYPRVIALFDNNSSIPPNLISFNILIKAFCEKSDLDAALDALARMEGRGVPPDSISFSILLKGLYESGRFSDAEGIWERMKEGARLDARCFNAKMRGLVSVGRTLEAVEVLGEMKRLGLKMDVFTYNVLMKGYCQDGELEEAKLVYGDLVKSDCVPNKETFVVLIPSLAAAGDVELAVRLSKESLSRRCSPGSEILQGLVDGLVRNSEFEEAKKLVEISRANGYSRKSIRLPLACLAV